MAREPLCSLRLGEGVFGTVPASSGPGVAVLPGPRKHSEGCLVRGSAGCPEETESPERRQGVVVSD